MKRKRYFGVILEPKRAEMHCDELPELKDDELLLQLEACNICTTDYQQWQGLRNHQGFPRAAGHEFCGIVIERGSKVHSRFQIGDRVGPVFPEFCGVCENCQRGRTGDCIEADFPMQDLMAITEPKAFPITGSSKSVMPLPCPKKSPPQRPHF